MAEIEVTRETEATTTQAETAQLNNDMKANYLTPLWQIEEEFMSVRPRPKIVPWLWKWSNLYSLAERAGRLVPVERGGDRRALGLSNPGLCGRRCNGSMDARWPRHTGIPHTPSASSLTAVAPTAP